MILPLVGKTDDETVANFKRLLRSNTRAVICTGASNVFGERLPTAKLARLAMKTEPCLYLTLHRRQVLSI